MNTEEKEIVEKIETTDKGECQRCKRKPATKDYNGHQYYVCDHCYKHLNDEFDEEYQ